MAQTKKQIGDRGKWAEAEVTDVLTEWNKRKLEFAFERLADARAARGAIKAQLCDFICQVSYNGDRLEKHFVMLEVKETRHDYRLAKDKVAQLPLMKKWLRAHAEGLLLVYHSVLQKWRAVCLSQLTIGLPSWDLRDAPLYDTAEQALVSFSAFRGFKQYGG